MNRVVVTGIGAVCPLGNTVHDSWSAARDGISGISQITKFDVSDIKWKIAGEVKDFRVYRYLSRKEINRLDPFVQYAVAAAIMAEEDAGLFSSYPSLNSGGIIVGSSRGGISTVEKAIQKRCFSHDNLGKGRVSAYLMPSSTISMASSYISQKFRMKGYCLGISNACASGTNAVGEAYRLIRSGYEGPVLCGGAEAPVCRICIEGYGSSGALSMMNASTASRPFDRTRDGFVLSEGACILVLENYEHALNRGARVYGEIIGYGNTTDSFHQTIPSSDGEARAIQLALNEAGVGPEDIDFISAHGTSTPLGDKTETEAIKLIFGKRAYQIPVSALKSMTGHMLAASGALEVAFTLKSIDEGIIFPTINLSERDTQCDLDYVTQLRNNKIRFAVSQSFGFGGVNAVLILKKVHV